MEEPIVADDKEEFLQRLQNIDIIDDTFCPSNTLEFILDALDYTLPEPHLYVITDSRTNDLELAKLVSAAIEEKLATVRIE